MKSEKSRKVYKNKLIYIGIAGAAFALIGLGVSQKEDAPGEDIVQMTESEQVEWIDAFNAQALEGGALFKHVKDTFNETYESLEDEQKEKALDTFVYAIQEQAQRLNSVGMSFIEEIKHMNDAFEDVDFIYGEDFAELPPGIVKGLLFEMDKTYTTLVKQDKGQLVIGIDVDKLMDKYGEDMATVTKNRLELIRFEQEHALFDYTAGHTAFDTAWKALDLIKTLPSETEEQFYQNEWPRLYYARTLLGYEEESMNDHEGNLNEKAVKAMEAVIEEHAETERAKVMQRVVDALREEGRYGEYTKGLIDEIIQEHFSELLEEKEPTT